MKRYGGVKLLVRLLNDLHPACEKAEDALTVLMQLTEIRDEAVACGVVPVCDTAETHIS